MAYRMIGAWGVLVLAAALTGCLFPPSTIPMATRSITPGAGAGSTLIVLLHGRGGAPEDFETGGFPQIASESGVKAELLLADAHQGYYKDHTILTRLHDDIVQPAIRNGRKVWLVGVSMGGTGALMYAKRYPGELAGVFAIAPFLGSGAEVASIIDAGGIDAWSLEGREEIFPWELWGWFKTRPASQGAGTLIYVGYGTEDKVARAGQLLADVFPKERLSTTKGGHTWAPWRQLWSEFLRSGALNSRDE